MKKVVKLVCMITLIGALVGGLFTSAFASATNLNEAIDHKDGWRVYTAEGSKITVKDGMLALNTGIASYPADNLYNSMIQFQFKADCTDSSAWPTFCIRDQFGSERPIWEGGSGYLFTFKSKQQKGENTGGVIEIGKYLEGVGSFLELVSPNPYFSGDDAVKIHHVEFGAINEGEAVRIILKIDGKEIVNLLDDKDPIRDPGNFSLYAWDNNSVAIGKVNTNLSTGGTGKANANPSTGDVGLITFIITGATGATGLLIAKRKRK